MPILARTMVHFMIVSPTDMYVDSRTNRFEQGGIDMCSGGLIGHSNTKDDGDHSTK